MKIIRRGLDTSEREWTFNCIRCGSIFECLQREGKMVHVEQNDEALEVACPVCKRTCWGSLK